MKKEHLLIPFALGLVLTVTLLWSLSNLAARLPVARAASYTVCLAGPPDCDYSTIQAAVDSAGEGDVIKVATGNYTDINNYGPGGAQVVYINKTLTLRGGYNSIFSDPPNPEANPTTLDAQGQGRVLYITGDISPTVEGLFITGGDTYGNGGGIAVNDGATLTLSHAVIADNAAGSKGGGIAINWGSSAVIADSKFYANTSDDEGGGISANIDSFLNLSRSWVVANASLFNDAGGINCDYCSSAYIENSIIAGNVSEDSAGGLLFGDNGGGSYRIVNSHIIGNHASGKGSALATFLSMQIEVTNTLIISNTGITGIDDKYGNPSIFLLSYCDTYGNSPDGTAGVTITRINCLGTPPEDGLNPQMSGGALPAGAGPAFAAQWMSYDYSLQVDSPAIDAGTSAGAPATDIKGTLRDAAPDIGAYELLELLPRIYLPLVRHANESTLGINHF